jgi:hypothetical protein
MDRPIIASVPGKMMTGVDAILQLRHRRALISRQ